MIHALIQRLYQAVKTEVVSGSTCDGEIRKTMAVGTILSEEVRLATCPIMGVEQ